MSRIEPTMPVAVASTYRDNEDETSEERLGPNASVFAADSTTMDAYKRFGRRAVGMFLLMLTVFLWTASNFLASTIFADDTYSKPYFVTYINTASFIIPLIPILIQKAIKHPEEMNHWRNSVRAKLPWMRYSPLGNRAEDESEAPYKVDGDTEDPMLSSQDLLLPDPMESSQTILARTPSCSSSDGQLSLKDTLKLSLEFCMLWFLANYFVAACLEYTTVASSTILTSTSSVFTLLFGAVFRVERFTIRKLLAVLASLAGIALISCMDLTGETNDDEHRGDFPQKSLRELAIGDLLAFLSAVMYGLYSVFMKKRIEDETRVNMPLFFGLVGTVNIFILWPGFFILHYTGIEKFELPPTSTVTIIISANSLASLVSDIAWAYAVLLTSPIVVTVGLSMTIPLSLVGQMVLNNQTSGWLYWVGALVVVLSFLFVNEEEKKEEVEAPTRDEESDTTLPSTS
ncbi:hypothetical protein K431DRAFT_282762 [Polychaeton citri CBS 116435]|uniref:EamA domain-containing protein n=1 Tax=Polychaeton citri CBS 116435 TaxID=1314669 RepID=A0A9P4QCH0_9PEZI|nr:hypothetical protein K431DRAFT_282762 [Polychaeton citri CBS 116435]